MLITEFSPNKLRPDIVAPTYDYFNAMPRADDANYYTKKRAAFEMLQATLKRNGWTYLDEGYYSTVFSNPNKSFVLKINTKPDTGYERYVSVIKKHKNKHFPIISDMKVVKIDHKNLYVYLIEKLTKLTSIQAMIYSDFFSSIIRRPYKSLDDIFNYDVPTIFKTDPSLVRALRIVGQCAEDSGLDMHGGNIMQRTNGTIVITDPYS